ncbi:ABC transporter ATP-binding protein [Cardinium endosymbiont of Culicoides punctatus]|uniref:ABC transporter ATP-binding protein n=1 Tax=Cardinium endosymbiont of Culicoides punctatus TaxID=2304601 RepID=UPI0010E79BA0|nr:ABC transporter ATP-binding protein [Cardinium endosymbiont of Culicoides punctatus]TDG95629.1 Multidrug resistance ABC transporter ATP-binding/permease protein BmrA [Cardinium endosymbiont of Culicoides punctatus]
MLLSVLLIVSIVASGIFPLLAIKVSSQLIDHIVTTNVIATQTILYHLLYLGALWLMHDLINPWILFLQSSLADKVVFVINRSIIDKSNAIQGLAYFEQQDFHNDLQIILSQAYHKPVNLVVTLVGLLRDFTLIVSCIVLLFSKISWLSVLVLISIVVHAKIISKMQQEIWKESLGRSTNSRMMNYISALSINPSFAKEIRLFPISNYLSKEYSRLFQMIYLSMLKIRRRQLLWPIFSCFISLVSNLAVLLYLTLLIKNGTLMVGAITLLLQTLSQLHQSVLSFGEQIGWMSGHLLFFEKYFQFLDRSEQVYTTPITKKSSLTINTETLHISFDNISFVYPDGRKALQDINFEIQPKEKLAIVGANGAGKTSLIKLLCGFYAPTTGIIRINGLPIEEYDIQEVRALIAPVFQDFGTYALTLKQNIIMGDELDNELKLHEILKKAEINFIDVFKHGLNQNLGKVFGGTDLSIGQWQKVAIARALYKNASLFILDEPTAALDPISEHKIFNQFGKICKEKTTIFVTHRLNSIKMADRILLLDEGRQIAIDTHHQLLQHNALYREMFESQASQYADLKTKPIY